MDPGFSFKNGAGAIILDGDSYQIKACDLFRPFAPGLDDQVAAEEIRKKIRRFWENHVGFSFDPIHIVMEYPRSYPRSTINQNPLIRIGTLIGMVRADFKTPIEKVHLPNAYTWKGNAQKVKTQELVQESLDRRSANILSKTLSALPNHLHHNIYDAIGLGLWAIKNIFKK